MRFLFVDKILELEKGKRAVMVKNVSNSEDYFTHHFPDFPVMPGALMVEALEQAAGILISYSLDFKALAVLLQVENAKFRGVIRPGDQLLLEVVLREMTETSATVAAKIRLENKSAATMKFLFSLMHAADADSAAAIEKIKYLYDLLTQRIYQQSFN
ncbi:MAG: beta-hydroxyacyl-ACP dehydratase [Desulfobacterales bacterium]|nr:MAG: beta-hydroxyacyl-ACP dehydratase [Desulfobacterales bacterium]